MAMKIFSDEYLSKIKSVLTDEWQPAIDIAHWAEVSPRHTHKILKAMYERDEIERMWDANLGIYYFRLLSGESFHKASEEKKAVKDV